MCTLQVLKHEKKIKAIHGISILSFLLSPNMNLLAYYIFSRVFFFLSGEPGNSLKFPELVLANASFCMTTTKIYRPALAPHDLHRSSRVDYFAIKSIPGMLDHLLKS